MLVPTRYHLTDVTVVVVGGGPVLGVFFFVFFLGGRLEEFPEIQCNMQLMVNTCNQPFSHYKRQIDEDIVKCSVQRIPIMNALFSEFKKRDAKQMLHTLETKLKDLQHIFSNRFYSYAYIIIVSLCTTMLI